MFHQTLVAFRRATVTIPRLSPTLTKAKIREWCFDLRPEGVELKVNDPVFILECSTSLVVEGFQDQVDDAPSIIVESQEEGKLVVNDDIKLDTWYEVGHKVGVIDDGDQNDKGDTTEWLWQGYKTDGAADQNDVRS